MAASDILGCALTQFEKCLFSPYWQINHKVAVSYSILQACYQFTLVARLAPKWNQISNWLVKGVHTPLDILLQNKLLQNQLP